MTSTSIRSKSVSAERPLTLQLLAVLLGLEAVLALAVAIGLSMVAGAADEAGDGAATGLRFAAGGAVIAAIVAYRAARNAWRARRRAYAQAGILQLVVVAGLALGMVVAGWHPALLGVIALATGVFILLSTQSVRNALGQG